jgi:hypothetical protein
MLVVVVARRQVQGLPQGLGMTRAQVPQQYMAVHSPMAEPPAE